MNIKEIVRSITKKYKTSNIYELADAMGIYIYSVELGTIRGYYYQNRRIKQVFLNCNLPDYMKKFVLAHEIGHAVMHPTSNAPFLQTTLLSVDKLEVEANKFAAELIIPDMDLMEHWEYTVDELAMFYGLPREIIELRMR